jgi:hypothetical protein
MPLTGDVASNGNVLVAQIFGGLKAQYIGNRMGIGVEKFLIGNSR